MLTLFLDLANSMVQLNSENCPLRQQNLVNNNVTLRVSQGSGGPETANLEVNFEGDYFGKFDW